jgi:N-acetylmuramoyl-L-alanine amidase
VNPQQAYEFTLLSLAVWREARGEVVPAQFAVAWSIRNRVLKPGWWGKDWISVILKPMQYSSFNANDPNAVKWPAPADASWMACLQAAGAAYAGDGTDPTSGSTHYYDRSLDANLPSWATSPAMVHVTNIGNLRFYKPV